MFDNLDESKPASFQINSKNTTLNIFEDYDSDVKV